jgi:hypothetical protein
MPNKTAARLLNQLEQTRTQIGTVKEREVVRLLNAAGRVTFGKDARSLIRLHDLLLFFRAFPPGPNVLRLAERLLKHFEPRVKAVLAAGGEADDFAPEEVVGIVGTVVDLNSMGRLRARDAARGDLAAILSADGRRFAHGSQCAISGLA